MSQLRMRVNVALDSIAKQSNVAFWPDMDMSASADLQKIARRRLMDWYDGNFVPLVNGLVPDRIVISAARGNKVLARWTIADEIEARVEEGRP